MEYTWTFFVIKYRPQNGLSQWSIVFKKNERFYEKLSFLSKVTRLVKNVLLRAGHWYLA